MDFIQVRFSLLLLFFSGHDIVIKNEKIVNNIQNDLIAYYSEHVPGSLCRLHLA